MLRVLSNRGSSRRDVVVPPCSPVEVNEDAYYRDRPHFVQGARTAKSFRARMKNRLVRAQCYPRGQSARRGSSAPGHDCHDTSPLPARKSEHQGGCDTLARILQTYAMDQVPTTPVATLGKQTRLAARPMHGVTFFVACVLLCAGCATNMVATYEELATAIKAGEDVDARAFARGIRGHPGFFRTNAEHLRPRNPGHAPHRGRTAAFGTAWVRDSRSVSGQSRRAPRAGYFLFLSRTGRDCRRTPGVGVQNSRQRGRGCRRHLRIATARHIRGRTKRLSDRKPVELPSAPCIFPPTRPHSC